MENDNKSDLHNELRRILSLSNYHLNDTSTDKPLEKIALIASHILETEIALVSILEKERQWFKAKIGTQIEETPREHAFCNYTILGDKPYVIEDTQLDGIFQEHPLVLGEPRIRFYAGAPIISSSGDALGTVCVIDTAPKSVSKKKLSILSELANLASSIIESNKNSRLIENLNLKVNKMGGSLPICFKCKKIKTSIGEWQLLETFMKNEVGAILSHSVCKLCEIEIQS